MKKSTVLQSVVGTLVVALAIGCATGMKGASDEECIETLLRTWEASIVEVDVDKVLTTYSENFSHDGYEYDAADKEGLREYIEYSIEEGYFDGVEISFDDAETIIEGNTATVYPIEYVNDLGAVTIGLTVTKAKDGWRFTDMEIEGL